MMRRAALTLLMMAGTLLAGAQTFSVGTDMAWLALQTYNIGAEMTVGNRSTLGLSVLTNNKPYWNKDMKLTAVQPEWRYYFGGRPMYHHFVGVAALATDYDMKWGKTRYDGFAVGAGLTFGYVLSLSSRWTVDAHAGFGLTMFRHKETREGVDDLTDDRGLPAKTAHTGYMILPQKVGITLSYIIR